MTLALVAGACSASRGPAAASTTSSIPASTTTTEPPPQYAPSPYSWDRAASPALALGGGPSATLSALLAPQLTGSWLLFGSRLGTAGAPAATVWSSPDGLTWTATALGTGPGQIAAAAEYRTETVAVGSTGEGAGQQAAVWLSPQAGAPFTPQSVPSSTGPSVMTQVAAGALGMFAAGTVDGRFAMWSSTNGRRWSELPGAEKVITGTPGARVNALLAEGDNIYAAGSIQSGTTPQAALWATGDGINWRMVGSAASSFSGLGGRVIYSLAPLGTGLVAVGAVDEGSGWQPASWISPDGQSWSLPSVDFPAVPNAGAATAALGASGGSAARFVSAIPTLAGPTSVVAAGGGPDGQGAWRSSDGLHWSSLSMPAPYAAATSWRAEMVGATIDTTVVLDAEPGQPYLLTDRSGRSGSVPPPPTTTASATSSAAAGNWSQPSANPSVFGPVRAQALPVSLRVAGGRLLLTVDVVRRPQTIGPSAVSTVVLSSTDGSAWTASSSGPATAPGSASAGGSATPPTLPAAGALTARLPGTWVAVSPGTGRVWTSPTGVAWKKAAALSAPSASPAAPAGVSQLFVNGVCTARLTAPGGAGTTASTSASASPRYVAAVVGTVAVTSIPPTNGTTRVTEPGTPATATITTRSATVWYSTTGATWRDAAVAGAPPPGGTSSMSGCLAAGSELVGYGTASSAGGAPVPALWRSSDGSTWSRLTVSAFAAGTPGPLVSMAAYGDYWLAAANPEPAADPFSPAAAGGTATAGPAAAAGTDAGIGPSASLENGRVGLWLSPDGGSTWQIIDTATAPWMGVQRSVVDLVAFAPGSAVHATSPTTSTTSTGDTGTGAGAGAGAASGAAGSVPVVVGVVDGQLAVWTGTAVPTGS